MNLIGPGFLPRLAWLHQLVEGATKSHEFQNATERSTRAPDRPQCLAQAQERTQIRGQRTLAPLQTSFSLNLDETLKSGSQGRLVEHQQRRVNGRESCPPLLHARGPLSAGGSTNSHSPVPDAS